MKLLIFWTILAVVSLLAAISDTIYKSGSTELKESNAMTMRQYVRNLSIIISWALVIISKLIIGIPYSVIDLSIAVPVNNILVALFGSLMGVVFLKEKLTNDILKAYFFSVLACLFLVFGEL